MNDAGVVHGHGQLPVVVLVLERHPLAAAVEHPLVILQVVDGDAGPKVAGLQSRNQMDFLGSQKVVSVFRFLLVHKTF